MNRTEWFEEESEAGSTSRHQNSLELFDDSRIIEETKAGVILAWLAQRLARRFGGPAGSTTPTSKPPHNAVERNPRHLAEGHQCRPRLVGWSLVIAAFAIVALALVTVASGATAVGVIACGGLTVSVLAMVVAEIISRN